MSRTYFRDLVNEPSPVNNTLVTLAAATDTIVFPANQIAIPNANVRQGKVWKLTASGLATTGGSASTWLFTLRWGQVLASPSLGQGGITVAPPVSSTAEVWFFEAYVLCQAAGVAGANNSVVVGNGMFTSPSTGTAGQAWVTATGGSSVGATFDIGTVNIAGIQLSINASVAGSITPNIVTLEALN